MLSPLVAYLTSTIKPLLCAQNCWEGLAQMRTGQNSFFFITYLPL